MAGNPRRPPSSWCVTSPVYCWLLAFVTALAVLQVAKPGSYQHVVCHMFSENMLLNGTVSQQVLSVHFYSIQQMCVMQGLLFRGHNLAIVEQRVACTFTRTRTSHHTSSACRPSITQWAVGLLAIGIIVQFFWKRQAGITSANFPGELQKAARVNSKYASAVSDPMLCCIFV